jgi:sigma-B regulation protein RsbU (phosphoserine phosphatase)
MTPTLQNKPYRIPCSSIWGGIEPASIDVCTQGVTASLYSTASGGQRGGDMYYMSVCSNDLLTRMVVADVRGHGEQVSEISAWLYQCLQDRMNSLDGAGVLSDLNRIVHERGFAAITTAAVVSYYISNSKLCYSYAGHPPVLARRTGGRWLPLVLEAQSGKANLPLGVLPLVHYDQAQVRLEARDRFLLYTDGLSEATDVESDEEFGERELPALLDAKADLELASVRDALIERATAFSGGPLLSDDCTLIVVEVR